MSAYCSATQAGSVGVNAFSKLQPYRSTRYLLCFCSYAKQGDYISLRTEVHFSEETKPKLGLGQAQAHHSA